MSLHLVAIVCLFLAFIISVARLVVSIRADNWARRRARFVCVYGFALLLGGSLLHGTNKAAADIFTLLGAGFVFYYTLLIRWAKATMTEP